MTERKPANRPELHISSRLLDLAAQVAVERTTLADLTVGATVGALDDGITYRIESIVETDTGHSAVISYEDRETQQLFKRNCDTNSLFGVGIFLDTLSQLAAERTTLPAVAATLRQAGVKNKRIP